MHWYNEVRKQTLRLWAYLVNDRAFRLIPDSLLEDPIKAIEELAKYANDLERFVSQKGFAFDTTRLVYECQGCGIVVWHETFNSTSMLEIYRKKFLEGHRQGCIVGIARNNRRDLPNG